MLMLRLLLLSILLLLILLSQKAHSWILQSLQQSTIILSRRRQQRQKQQQSITCCGGCSSRFFAAASMSSSTTTTNVDAADAEGYLGGGGGGDDDDSKNEIIMLSGYPFYTKGPDPKEIEKVAAQVKTTLQQCCGDQVVKHVSRMGSSAIDGIAGTPVCDMLAQVDPWPLTDEAKQRLTQAGYEFQGNAPHAPQDEWFFGGDGEPGHLGRVVLHTVPVGSEFCRDMVAFVEYVKSHPDAFERYNRVKVEGAVLMSKSEQQEGRLIGYKQKKAAVTNAIKAEAIEWYKKKSNEASS